MSVQESKSADHVDDDSRSAERRRGPLDKGQVLDAIHRELSATAPSRSVVLREKLANLRWAIGHFRSEPYGGRLKTLKACAYWFVASAFDRQGKVLEAMTDLLDEAVQHIEQLEEGGATRRER